MELTTDFLIARHSYWKNRICEAGIWKHENFKPVELVIRPDRRSYNGVFQRRIKIKNGKKEVIDKIFIYRKVDDFDSKFLDSVLVHEMIHQYIFQSNLKDTRTHGKLFREFMKRINETFGEELEIKISDKNPNIPLRGKGDILHRLLIVYFSNSTCYCAVIHPSRVLRFEKLMKRNPYKWDIIKYIWAESDDIYFNRYRRCMSSLHGIKKSPEELEKFCREYNIRKASYPIR